VWILTEWIQVLAAQALRNRDPLSVHLQPAPPTPSVDDCFPHLWTVLEPDHTRHVFTDYWRNIVGVEMAVVVGANS
jgi:hypothetical protein